MCIRDRTPIYHKSYTLIRRLPPTPLVLRLLITSISSFCSGVFRLVALTGKSLPTAIYTTTKKLFWYPLYSFCRSRSSPPLSPWAFRLLCNELCWWWISTIFVAHLPRDLYGGRVLLSLIHISEPTRPERISYAVFCLKKKSK